jgi:hypothetical protein
MELAATYLPDLEMLTLLMFLSSFLAKMVLTSRVVASQMTKDGQRPSYPVAMRPFDGFKSRQVMSSLWAVLTRMVFLFLLRTIPQAAVWYTTSPWAL